MSPREFTAPIQFYENGVFAIIREGPSEGMLISLKTRVARSFIHGCKQVLRGER